MAPVATPSRRPAGLLGLHVASRQAADPGSSIATWRLHAAAAASNPLVASRTIDDPSLDAIPSRVRLHARQQTTDTVPGHYPDLNSGPDPGTVVGIVLGAVGGFLLLLWLVYTCLQIGGRGDTVSSYGGGTESVVTRKSHRRHQSRHSRHHNSNHHRSPARRETVEVRTSRVVPPAERIVVEEHVRRTSSQHAAPPPAPMPGPPPPRMMTPRVVTTDDEEDEVVVIEEHSPPRRHKSRSRRRRSSSAARRESGFREVDPDRFAGGDASFRDVRRSSRHGR